MKIVDVFLYVRLNDGRTITLDENQTELNPRQLNTALREFGRKLLREWHDRVTEVH